MVYDKRNKSLNADIRSLAGYASARFGTVDVWINNAGVNQPMKALWELSEAEIDALLNIDLRGTVLGSRTDMNTAIVYCSKHHGNTKNLLNENSEGEDVTLINMTEPSEKDLSGCNPFGLLKLMVGIAKGHPTDEEIAAARR